MNICLFDVYLSAMEELFSNPIEYLKGVGPQKAELIASELNIHTFGDLLSYFPFRYVDKSNYVQIANIQNENTFVLLKGKISGLEEAGETYKKRLIVKFKDESGELNLIWFKGIRWIKPKLQIGREYTVFGKPSVFNNKFNFTHPEIEEYNPSASLVKTPLFPIYNTSEKMKGKGLTSKGVGLLTQNVLIQAKGKIRENLPHAILEEYGLVGKEKALFHIHYPPNFKALEQAERRLKFEELFLLQLDILVAKGKIKNHKGYIFDQVGDKFHYFYKHKLQFALTKAQERVIKEIRFDTKTGFQMNRLLQGDVGSGKTIVALMCMLFAIDNGYQCALMAPTEILAKQHYENFKKLLDGMDIPIHFLSGSIKRKKERREILTSLQSGETKIIIGTHALIEDQVQFHQLGFVVIDEQHRFGVAQRSKLWSKSAIYPHVLVMTATPIPRTLSMTLYGDLEVSIIDELPPNRKEIITLHVTDKDRGRVNQFVKEQIEKGRQIYVVYPLINESEKLDLRDLEEGYWALSKIFPLPTYAISIVHGRLSAEEKNYEMNRFKIGETQLMVSTTVIEVGVDVPNASVMIIENSERFGLAQLHQLRGRVGRGGEQSYCILMTKNLLNSDSKERIETMVQNCDGFKIAEVDLRLRGPGNIQGTQQSGILDLKIADIVKDEKIIKIARNCVLEILKEDPNLEQPQHRMLKEYVVRNKHKTFWSKIS